MKKSLLALLLVMALVVTVSVFAVSAETTNPFDGQTGEVTAECQACKKEVVWAPIPTATDLKVLDWDSYKTDGRTHFYLTGKSTLDSDVCTLGEGVKLCIELNGYRWERTSKSKANAFFYMNGEGAVLSIMDSSADESGAIVIPKTSGSIIGLKGPGTVNMYSGNLIGSGVETTNPSGSSGTCITTVKVDDVGVSTATFNMYGGTLRGRSQYSGGVINISSPSTINIENGTIEGKAGGSTGGVLYINHADAKLYMKSGSITGGQQKQTSSTGVSQNNAIGSAVKISKGTFEMTGGTLTGTSRYGGGLNIGSAEVTISGGTITGTTKNGGGAVYMTGSAGNLTISGGTITGTSAAGYSGGTLRVTDGDVTISGGKITGGNAPEANGGNIYWSSTGTLTISGGEITGGTATYDTEGKQYGRGGNIHFTNGTLNITGGKITGGNAYDGGNLSFISGVTVNISGGEITGGTASNYGGNIYSGWSKLTVDAAAEKTVTISDGTATAGGNLYIMEAAANTEGFANIIGPNVTITKGSDGGKISAGSATEQVGSHITIVGAEGNPCTVSIKDTNVNYYASGKVHTTQVTLMDYAELEVDGTSRIDCVYVAGNMNGKVTVKEGFTGKLVTRWRDNTINKTFRQPGATIPANLWQEIGYVNGATVQVTDDNRTAMDVVDMGDAVEANAETGAAADNMFRVAAVYGFKVDGDGKVTKTLLGAMPTEEDGYAFVRPRYKGTFTLTGDTTFDIGELVCHINTGEYQLNLMEKATDEFAYTEGYVTVDNADNLVRKTEDAAYGYQYITVPMVQTDGSATRYTAHRVKVDIDAVFIKPASASLYYTTNMDTTLEASGLAKSYGVVLSLANMPGENFADDLNSAGMLENLYTQLNFELAEDQRVHVEGASSALLTGILNQGAPAGQNKAWGEMPVFANAYIRFEIDGASYYVMADETRELSLLDILKLVDANETLVNEPSVLKMYKLWTDPLAAWAEEGHLTNIRTAYEAVPQE